MRFNSYFIRMNRFAEILRLVFISLIDIAAYSSLEKRTKNLCDYS